MIKITDNSIGLSLKYMTSTCAIEEEPCISFPIKIIKGLNSFTKKQEIKIIICFDENDLQNQTFVNSIQYPYDFEKNMCLTEKIDILLDSLQLTKN